MYPLKQSTALDILIFVHDANGDGVTGIADGSFTKRISKNGAAFAAMTVTITERENGWYLVPLSTSHTDTLGVLTCSFSATGAKRVNVQFRVHARVPDDLAYPASSGQSLSINGSGQVVASSVATGGIVAGSFAAGAIDAAAIATDAIGSAELAASAASEIAAAVWEELRSAHTAAGTFGRAMQIIRDGTAQAGAGGSITLDAGASASDSFYNACLIEIVSGTGAGQSRFISGYTGATKVATVQGNWLTAPDNTSVFTIYPFGTIPSVAAVTGAVGSIGVGGITAGSFAANAIDGNAIATDAIGSAELAASAAVEIAAAVWDESRASHTAGGSFGQGVASVQGNVTGSVGSVASGGITATSFGANAIDAAAIAPDAIGSAEIAATAAAEIAAAVWEELRSAHTTAGTFGRSAQIIRDGTAQAGAAGSITLDAGASGSDGFYTNQLVEIVSGTGVGQARQISGYTGATKVATVSPNWTTNPDNTSVFVLLPFAPSSGSSPATIAAAVWDEARSGHVTAGSFGQGVASVQGNVTGSVGSVAAGGITATSFGAGAIDANAIATDAITSVELAASAVSEIAAGVWDEPRSSHVAAGSFGRAAQVIRDGTAQAGAAGSITLDAGASASDGFYTNAVVLITGGTGIGQARGISGYTGATKVATVSPNWTTTPDNTSTFAVLPQQCVLAPTAAQNAAAVWDEARAGHVTAGSFGQGVASVQGNVTGSVASVTAGVTVTTNNDKTGYSLTTTESAVLHSGTAQAGAGSAITLAAGASATNDLYKGLLVKITGGTGAGQARTIIGYVGATKVATVDRAWATSPDNTSAYALEAADGVALDPSLNVTTTALSSQALTDIKSQVTAVLVTDTFAEPAAVPAATASLKDKIGWLMALARNKITETATTQTLRNAGDTATVGTATVSDDGTTAIRGAWV